jgi:hypothetical protein
MFPQIIIVAKIPAKLGLQPPLATSLGQAQTIWKGLRRKGNMSFAQKVTKEV